MIVNDSHPGGSALAFDGSSSKASDNNRPGDGNNLNQPGQLSIIAEDLPQQLSRIPALEFLTVTGIYSRSAGRPGPP